MPPWDSSSDEEVTFREVTDHSASLCQVSIVYLALSLAKALSGDDSRSLCPPGPDILVRGQANQARQVRKNADLQDIETFHDAVVGGRWVGHGYSCWHSNKEKPAGQREGSCRRFGHVAQGPGSNGSHEGSPRPVSRGLLTQICRGRRAEVTQPAFQ